MLAGWEGIVGWAVGEEGGGVCCSPQTSCRGRATDRPLLSPPGKRNQQKPGEGEWFPDRINLLRKHVAEKHRGVGFGSRDATMKHLQQGASNSRTLFSHSPGTVLEARNQGISSTILTCLEPLVAPGRFLVGGSRTRVPASVSSWPSALCLKPPFLFSCDTICCKKGPPVQDDLL